MKRRAIRSPLAAPLSFYFMALVATTFFAVNMAESVEYILYEFSLVMVAFFVPIFINRYKDFEIMVFLMGILAIAVDVYALAQQFDWTGLYPYFNHLGSFNPNTNRWYNFTYQPVSFLGNRNYAGEVLNLLTPVCGAMVFMFMHRAPQLIFYSFVTLLNIITLYYIDCNASYMGLVVALPISFVIILYFRVLPWMLHIGLFTCSREYLEYRTRQVLVVGVLLVALLVTFVNSVDNKIRDKIFTTISWVDSNGDNRPEGSGSIVFRLQCMDATMRQIADTPFFGTGPGNYKELHPLYEKQLERKVLGEETLARKVHNDHLQHAAEFGFFGEFGWYWSFTTVFFLIYRSYRFTRKQEMARAGLLHTSIPPKVLINSEENNFYFYLLVGAMTSLLVSLVDSVFAHTFVITAEAMLFYLIMGISAAVYQRLVFADKGIVLPLYVNTNEKLTSIQVYTQRIPGYLKWAALFLLVTPFGTWNLSQTIGEGYLKQGMDARERNDFTTCFNDFDKAMKLYPYQMEIYYILGRYYIDALVMMDTAFGYGEKGAEELQKVGLSMSDRQQMNDRGIVCLQTDLFMNPNYKWAHNNLGVLYDRYSYPQKFAADFNKYFPVDPKDPNFERVSIAARNTYYRVLAIDNEQVYAHYNLGLGYMNDMKYDLSASELEKAQVSDPSKIDTFRFMARCFIEKGDPSRALAATDKYAMMYLYEKGVSVQPTENNIQNVKSAKQMIKAFDNQELDKGLEIARKELDWTSDEIGKLYLRIAHDWSAGSVKDPQKAILAMSRAEKLYPNPNQEFLVIASQVYLGGQNYEKAAQVFQEYLRLEPKNTDIMRKLAQVYAILNRLDFSLEIFKKVMELEPNRWDNNVSYSRILMLKQYEMGYGFSLYSKSD